MKAYFCKCLKNMDINKTYTDVIYAKDNKEALKKIKKLYPKENKYTNHSCKVM